MQMLRPAFQLGGLRDAPVGIEPPQQRMKRFRKLPAFCRLTAAKFSFTRHPSAAHFLAVQQLFQFLRSLIARDHHPVFQQHGWRALNTVQNAQLILL